MKPDADTLRRLSPLIDLALELHGAQREAWLDALESESPELVPILRKVLSENTAKKSAHIFDQRPALTGLDGAELQNTTGHLRGDIVGPYRLLGELGHGGMGDVWLAERTDGLLKRSVALKLPIVSLRKQVLLQRFERERDILGALNHPHIARLYDAGVADDGQPYLALEYVQGLTITEYANRGLLDARARVKLLRQVMDAVQYAHANLVIHRDLKPGNVLVTDEGKALLLDFGIAKLLQAESSEAQSTELTRLGGGALTPQYAAPEQISGLSISIATDVWALGVLLFELLAAQRPFESASRSETETAVLSVDPVRPSQCRPGPITQLPRALASELDTIVLKALKKPPGERYATVGAFADDLDRWLNGEAVLAQPDSRWYRIRKFVGRHRVVVTTAMLAMASIVAIATVAVWQGLQAHEESARAVAARNFLIDMFRQADPDLSHGKDFTAKQLLDQGKQRILTTLESQPLLQSELLRGIADAQTNLAEYRQADSTLTEVVDRYVKLDKPLQAGDAQVAHANVVFRAGDVVRAGQLLDDAWSKMNAETSAKDTLALYYQIKSGIELSKGNSSGALEASHKSLDLAEQAFGPSDIKTVRALVAVAKVELSNGHYSVASPIFDEAIARAEATSHVNPRELLMLRADRALFHAGAGWFQIAAQQLAKIGDHCEQILDSHGETCSNFRRRESQIWLALGNNDRALKLMPAFMSRMANDESPQDQSDALMSACRILLLNGLQHQKPEWWMRLQTLAHGGSDVKLTEQVKLWAMLLEAERLVRETQPELALTLLSNAEERNSQTKQQYSRRLLFHIRLLQGMAAQQLGRHEIALKSLRDTMALYPRQVASDHPRYLLASLYQARSLWATNQRDKALALLDHALPKLEQSMGPDAPIYIKAAALRDELATTSPMPATARKIDLFL